MWNNMSPVKVKSEITFHLLKLSLMFTFTVIPEIGKK